MPKAKCYEFNYKIIEISSWIHTLKYKKKKHAIYEVFFSDFSVFGFVCLPKRNGAVAVDPALSSDPALYASFPRTRYCFYFICSFCWWRHYCFCDTLDGWRKAIFSLIIYIFYIEKLWLVSVLFYCVFCLIYFVACHGDTTMSN